MSKTLGDKAITYILANYSVIMVAFSATIGGNAAILLSWLIITLILSGTILCFSWKNPSFVSPKLDVIGSSAGVLLAIGALVHLGMWGGGFVALDESTPHGAGWKDRVGHVADMLSLVAFGFALIGIFRLRRGL